jgi:hypothetical protein
MVEELTTEELSDLRVILISFMADKEAHKKTPRLKSRAPKLWNKIDHMYKCKQKGNGNNRQSYGDQSRYFS